MLYFGGYMKRFIRPFAFLIMSLCLVLFSVAFSRTISVQPGTFVGNTGAAFFFQITPTPQPQVDKSEIGSTDGITIMSFVIVAIIIAPIFLLRKHWSQT
jgi:hypothetical protein